MSTVLYEHPLNERIRNYLKLEQFFAQIYSCLNNNLSIKTSHQVFFSALFSIIDTLERNDVRGDLIKDLEKLEQSLVIWSQAPDIDTTALEMNLSEAVKLIAHLRVPQPTWCKLKEDKLLASLKQRFAIQGGSSSFDLPQLHFWLHQGEAETKQEMQHWFNLLTDISSSLALVLKFIRQRAVFETIEVDSGFYQDNGEGILLLRIKIASDAPYYPTVSGNKFRYSIRFMLPCQYTGRRYANQATVFQLARC
ncbi:cell division protein ZapD [Colwellia sp. E2M01]|uniref:cell division protein ZapD n=1 Tax=Colwellia sp. E2M01 TaxID=2841561 RepID=UPI001C0A15E1|nr:cell division protein ZapD [Colwellia sp. E2M01]MBU2870207.1 cell division protein ZapD [Colwellia sp. E2M01]